MADNYIHNIRITTYKNGELHNVFKKALTTAQVNSVLEALETYKETEENKPTIIDRISERNKLEG
jgi:hypothetical protein